TDDHGPNQRIRIAGARARPEVLQRVGEVHSERPPAHSRIIHSHSRGKAPEGNSVRSRTEISESAKARQSRATIGRRGKINLIAIGRTERKGNGGHIAVVE